MFISTHIDTRNFHTWNEINSSLSSFFSLVEKFITKFFTISCFMWLIIYGFTWEVRHWWDHRHRGTCASINVVSIFPQRSHAPNTWLNLGILTLYWQFHWNKHSPLPYLYNIQSTSFNFYYKEGYIIKLRICTCHSDLLPDDNSSKQFCNIMCLSITWKNQGC
jgi:hypothetical protein